MTLEDRELTVVDGKGEAPSQDDNMAELQELCDRVLSQRPLLLASNRGPVEHQMTPEDRPEGRRGSGSVVTAFNSLIQSSEFTWVASAMGEGDRVLPLNRETFRLGVVKVGW